MDLSTPSFGALPDGADLLAIVGGHRYLSVAWVMRQSPGRQPEYYCPLLAWPETPAAQLAAKDATIAELQQRIVELEARLRERESEPPAEERTTDNGQPTADRKLPPGRVQCPHCPKRPWANKLADHLSEAHPEQLAVTTIPIATVADVEEETAPARSPAILPVDPTWSCARCESNAHTRSIVQPDLCMRCAASAPATTNGHLVAA